MKDSAQLKHWRNPAQQESVPAMKKQQDPRTHLAPDVVAELETKVTCLCVCNCAEHNLSGGQLAVSEGASSNSSVAKRQEGGCTPIQAKTGM